jgi:hypothetical protein
MALGGIIAAPMTISLIHPAILRWITKAQTSSGYLVRSTISILPFWVVAYFFWNDFGRLDTALEQVLLGVFLGGASTLVFFWLVNVALTGAWLISVLLFGVSRFVLVRVVENPNGTVLGLSALVAIIGAWAKAVVAK